MLLTLDYLSFLSKKTAIQLVNEMGIGYNLGNTYNCCITSEEGNIKNEQINNFGTILPTQKQINQIKKYGFKTIRFQVVYNNLIYESKKTAIQLVNEMGIGYNLGKTYNFSITSEEDNIKNEQINNWGTILPTKKEINQIKKYGFKTIRFQVVYNNLYNDKKIIYF